MDNIDELAQTMRNEWDRRVEHDYRFWMSDAYADDEAMWASGERDAALLFDGLDGAADQTLLEIGCGVGRLLRPALARFKQVIGLDVSEEALRYAREFLGSNSNLTLLTGNGYDLNPVEPGSVDVVASFAALTSMPLTVIARYLCESWRVLAPDGCLRLQVYLGTPQCVATNDTLHLRCFAPEDFRKGIALAGFAEEWSRELILPIQVSHPEMGINARLVSLKKTDGQPAEVTEIAAALLPEGELQAKDSRELGDLEALMVLNYAKQLTRDGKIDRAQRTLDYIESNSETLNCELDAMRNSMGFTAPLPQSTETPEPQASRSPKVVSGVLVSETEDGPVLSLGGYPLDHGSRPRRAAEKWVASVLQQERARSARRLVVFGLGAGYHVEALLDELSGAESPIEVSVIEPSPEVAQKAQAVRDLSKLRQRVAGFYVGEQIEQIPFGDDAELLIRPQTQALYSGYCNQVKSRFYGARGLSVLHPKIAVLGPIQGGTLPIMAYAGRALELLKQRSRVWDVSPLNPGPTLIEQFLKDPLRRNNVQGVFIEMISQMLLESADEKPIDILICMAQAPISGRVLTELRKRGVLTVLWFMEDYLRFTYWRQTAQYYDFVFTIQRGECIDAIRQAGAGAVHYLPMACDPGIHHPQALAAEEQARWGSPISFVGAGYHNRQQMFASLANLPFKIWGTEWPECRPFDSMVQEQGRRLSPAEYVKIFNATGVNINLHSSTERNGVDPYGDFLNPRTFELASCGAFQLVDQRSLLTEAFEPGREVVTFGSTAELKSLIDYYLAHPDERRAIAERGRERALREHTYEHRLREMLSIIYSSKFETLKAREEKSPWRKLLARAKPHEELHKRATLAFERGEEPILDGLVSDIVSGQGKLSETEQILMFLFHIRSQIIRMRQEEQPEQKSL